MEFKLDWANRGLRTGKGKLYLRADASTWGKTVLGERQYRSNDRSRVKAGEGLRFYRDNPIDG